MKKLILHIGFPKTGTTSLYHELIPHIRDVACYAPNTDINLQRQLLSENNLQHNLTLKKFLENLFISNKYTEDAIRILNNSQHNVVFLSSVNFMSGMFFKGLYTRDNSYLTPQKIARRLHEVFSMHFDVELLFTIRSQSSWLPSAFSEWSTFLRSHDGGNSLESFLNMFIYGGTKFNSLNYFSLYNEFIKYFPARNIHFFLFEKLKYDQFSFYQDFLNLIESNFDLRSHGLIRKRNVRSISPTSKNGLDYSLFNLLYKFKLIFFRNVSFNSQVRFPLLIKFLNFLSLPIKNTIRINVQQCDRIFKSYSDCNTKFFNRLSLDKKYLKYYAE